MEHAEKETETVYGGIQAKVVEELLKEEKTVGQPAAEYEVHSNLLYRWREQALAGLPGVFRDDAAREAAEKEA